MGHASFVRILVVDDYEPFRAFVRHTLQGRPELQIVGEAGDGLEAVHKAKALNPDVILLDIGLPKLNGIEAAGRISKLVPEATILFLSQCHDDDIVAAALSNGAKGYILKAHADRELLSALDAVREGNCFVGASIRKI